MRCACVRIAESAEKPAYTILNTGESYNGSITVSKTVHGGSNPSSPALNDHPLSCNVMAEGFSYDTARVRIFYACRRTRIHGSVEGQRAAGPPLPC